MNLYLVTKHMCVACSNWTNTYLLLFQLDLVIANHQEHQPTKYWYTCRSFMFAWLPVGLCLLDTNFITHRALLATAILWYSTLTIEDGSEQFFFCRLYSVFVGSVHLRFYRSLLWLLWRQTENNTRILDGRPVHARSTSGPVSSSQLHVCHHTTRHPIRGVCVWSTISAHMFGLHNHDTFSSTCLLTSVL